MTNMQAMKILYVDENGFLHMNYVDELYIVKDKDGKFDSYNLLAHMPNGKSFIVNSGFKSEDIEQDLISLFTTGMTRFVRTSI